MIARIDSLRRRDMVAVCKRLDPLGRSGLTERWRSSSFRPRAGRYVMCVGWDSGGGAGENE
jgi:hypothetical protein